MKYCDLHCDALTQEGVLQVTKENLRRGGCLLQCFAAFVNAEKCAPAGRFARATALCGKFEEMCMAQGYHPVRSVPDICEGEIGAMLTVEEGGAIEGSLDKLEALFARGVRMMTLTWNFPNELGYPNCGGKGREKERGLTAFGRETVLRMKELGMIVDVSHGSDRLVRDVAETLGKFPFVASHSGAAAVNPHCRNLEDDAIGLIADSGGAIGLDFCAEFTSADGSAEGQKRALLAHVQHILDVGGEDVPALGSDFDGIPPNPYLKDPAHLPGFLDELQKKFGARIAEKIAFRNALRVFRCTLPPR